MLKDNNVNTKADYVIVVEFYLRSTDPVLSQREVFEYEDIQDANNKYIDCISEFIENREKIGSVTYHLFDEETGTYIITMNSLFY